MVRRKPLATLVFCCGAWVSSGGGASQSAVIGTPLIRGPSELSVGSDTGLAIRGAAANSVITPLPVIAPPGGDADEFVWPGPPSDKTTEPFGLAPLAASERSFGPSADQMIASFEMSAAAGASGLGARQPSFDSLEPPTTGSAPVLLDELVAKPGDAGETGPFWVGKGDVVVNYLVPVLAVLALLVAGLLLRELVRRRQRAALARRIKRDFGRSTRGRPAPKSLPRSD